MTIWVIIWVIIPNSPPFYIYIYLRGTKYITLPSLFSWPAFFPVCTSISLSHDSIWICNQYSPAILVPLRAEEKCAWTFQLSRRDILIWLAMMDPGIGLKIGIRYSATRIRGRKTKGPIDWIRWSHWRWLSSRQIFLIIALSQEPFFALPCAVSTAVQFLSLF